MVNNKYIKNNLFCKVLFNTFVIYLLNKKLMSKLIREQIEKVKSFNQNKNNYLNKNIINNIYDVLSKVDGVINVSDYGIKYNDDGTLKMYNNTFYVELGNIEVNGVKYDYGNNYGNDYSKEKMYNYIDKAFLNIDKKIEMLNNTKLVFNKMKKVMDIIDSFNIEKYDNISFKGYGISNNNLKVTIYQKDELFA